MSYIRRLLIAVDQLLNAVLGGWPDETLSSRAWRWEQDGVRSWPRKFIDALFSSLPITVRKAMRANGKEGSFRQN